jgi:hypothetical protein
LLKRRFAQRTLPLVAIVPLVSLVGVLERYERNLTHPWNESLWEWFDRRFV